MMSKRKPGKPTLSPDEVERVLAALRKALKGEPHNGNQSSLARALRVEPSAISQLISGKNQPSYETAKALGAHIGEDFRHWLDHAPGVDRPPTPTPTPEPPAANDERTFYTRDQWSHLMDPALEILIREHNSAADSRDALESAVSFNTAKGRKPTLEDMLRFARTILKENGRDSGKIKKNKHS
jgi:transcriptional regulator with XRE-family HTH domain